MIVDVIDINLKHLKFTKNYDYVREGRAKLIHRNHDVTITSVDRIESNKYEINAIVIGNYDDYDVQLLTEGIFVKKYSCTCEDHNKGYICKHILATAMEVVNPHEATTSEGRKRLFLKQKEEETKRLELIRQKREEEKKQRLYEAKYRHGLNTLLYYMPDLDEADSMNLKELYQVTKASRGGEKRELATSIKLEPKIEIKYETCLGVTFKIGSSKMYVFNNIREFCKANKNEEEVYYGKKLSFIPKKENFEEDSKAYLDFIINYGEIIEYSELSDSSGYNNTRLSNKELLIMGDKIDEFFEILKNEPIVFNSCSYGEEIFEFTDKELEIECSISKEWIKPQNQMFWYDEDYPESEEVVLKLNISDYSIVKSNKFIYVFYDKKIYRLKRDKEYDKLFTVFKNVDCIPIPEDKFADFNKYVLPKLKKVDISNLPIEVSNEVRIVDKFASKILLDVDDKGNILLELKFCYGDYEFDVLSNDVDEDKIVRNIPEETEILKRIFNDGFELVSNSKYFILKNEDDTYEFLTSKIEGYMKDFEVLVTDKFKNKQIRRPKISSVGVRIDNGLLELDISKLNIDINEVKDVLKDYSIKKKYHKLKNGDFLNLEENETLDILSEMMTTLDVDYKKIQNGVVKLPVNRSIYLEKLLGDNKKIASTKNDNFISLIKNVENTESPNNIKIDESFKDILREYQKVGYKWLKTLEYYKFGGILADDMGLGKTLQVIALLKSELDSKIPSIVVCPSTLVLNWKSEIEKWCPEISTLIIKGVADVRKELINSYKDYNLIITSYDLLKRDVYEYEGKNFKYIIADEAQYIKNALTQNATSLKSLNGEVKLALTGTPIENSVAELWSIFDFVMPGYLYNYNKFKKKFEEPILKLEDKEALNRLKKLISPFILRRLKTDVLTELPEKTITIMKNEMDDEQQKIYLSYLAQTKEEVAEELSGGSFEKSKFKILMLLTRLRQICCHPSLFIENYKGDSGKLKQCMNLLNDAIVSGHKILLFSSYTSMFEIIEKELEKAGIKYFKLQGNTPVDKRIEMVNEFNSNEEIKVFLISLKAGGTGLNLTSADVVIHYDPWWNVSSENQATDRAYRIGQKNNVQVYKLITSNSIEEKINQMQERKAQLSNDLLTTEETFVSKLSKEEILDLFE